MFSLNAKVLKKFFFDILFLARFSSGGSGSVGKSPMRDKAPSFNNSPKKPTKKTNSLEDTSRETFQKQRSDPNNQTSKVCVRLIKTCDLTLSFPLC